MNIMKLISYLLALVVAVGATGCTSMVYDNEGDCQTTYALRLVYDHNLKFADAFNAEVKAVTLHVFDTETGKLVLNVTEQGEELAREDYTIDLPLKPGDYEMVAWCGEGVHDGGQSFKLENLQGDDTRKHHLNCRMQRNRHPETDQAMIDHENGLNRLYHGYLETHLPDVDGLKMVVKMPLVKNTNNVKVVLQSLSGDAINPDDFDFSIDDTNGHMDWDNSLIDDENLTYKPWAVTGGSAQILDQNYASFSPAEQLACRGENTMSAVVGDLTVGRMMTGNDPVLTVKNKNEGKTVFRIPLKEYALMVKGKYDRPMTDQEYLDRQDEYNMTFFLDRNGHWINAYIYINSWKVVLHDADIH